METPDQELEAEFNRVLIATDLLLTQRQRMWVAFRAGAEWAMKQIAKNAANPPSPKPQPPYYEKSSD